MSWRLEVTAGRTRSSKRTVKAISPNGEEYFEGDEVRLVNGSGKIAQFQGDPKDSFQIQLLYFVPAKDLGIDGSPDELLVTPDLRFCSPSDVIGHTKLRCSRAVDARLHVVPINWKSYAGQTVEKTAESITSLFKTESSARKVEKSQPTLVSAACRSRDLNNITVTTHEKQPAASHPSNEPKTISVSQTPRKRRKKDDPGSRIRTPSRRSLAEAPTPKLQKTPSKHGILPALPRTPQKIFSKSVKEIARERLHLSSIPDELPCREEEFSQLFLALESAISAGTGTCIYVSGTPGTGKTATVHEAVAQLELRAESEEIPHFRFLEINGMKLSYPSIAYDMLWAEVSGDASKSGSGAVSSQYSMAALEAKFHEPNKRLMTVVLLDELDQLITSNQGVIYNFFNWPSLHHSRLIVIAVANTLDLPERVLSNKISSRLGLTRIQFRGYNYADTQKIINTRLKDLDVMEPDAVEFIARKVASVSGDIRRALDISRRAIELSADGARVDINVVRCALTEAQDSPLDNFILSLSIVTKLLLCAILVRARRTNNTEMLLSSVLHQAEQLLQLSPHAEALTPVLYPPGAVRPRGYRHAVQELVEGGVLLQQISRGEAAVNIRLNLAPAVAARVLEHDPDVRGMI